MNKTHLTEKSPHSKELREKDLEFLLAESNISVWKSILLLSALCLLIAALTAVNCDKDVISFLMKM